MNAHASSPCTATSGTPDLTIPSCCCAGAWRSWEGADSTRFYCKSCWSGVVTDHPAYGGAIVLTQSKNISGADFMEPQGRHFQNDLSDEMRAAINAEMPWKGTKDTLYEGVSDNLMAAFPQLVEAGSTGVEMNLQKLLEKVGPPLVPDDPSLTAGPPSLMQRAAAAEEEKQTAA